MFCNVAAINCHNCQVNVRDENLKGQMKVEHSPILSWSGSSAQDESGRGWRLRQKYNKSV
jgi:hypothetical protein